MMEAMKREFIEAVVSRGHSQELGEEIYNLIEKFAEYGFNKSHSAGYALIAYQTGYLKAHHPVEFMAASMTSEIGDSDRIQKLANECKNLGIEILPPDVNESGIDFSVTTKGIRFGLIAVKNVGEGAVKAILEARRRVGIFNNIFNFITEVDPHQINRKALESLIQAGAFDSLERNRSKLFANIDRIMLYGNAVQEERVRGQFSFFESGGEGKVFSPPEMEPVSEWPRFERLSREKGVLGYFVSGHPLEKYRLEVENFSSPAIENLENMPDNAKVRLCGIITKVSKKLTKKGDLMALATIEDFTGSTEVLFFQKTFEQFKTLLIEDTMIALDGRTSTKEDEPVKVVVENAVPLERARTEFTRALQITLDTSQMTSDKMKKLETILKAYPGKTTLILMVCSGKSVCRLKSGRFTLEINDNLLKDLSDLAGKNNIRLLF
jgi:DNA polymerase-3 subunit alpha